MKVKLINLPNPLFSPIEQVLFNRNISYGDCNKFINLDINFRLDPLSLKNMEKGADLLLKHLKKNSNIYIIVDSDCDGYTSASALTIYLSTIKPDIKLNYIMHEGKEHGICEPIPDDCDFLIIPDASSNEIEKHVELAQRNIDILILDHHLFNRNNDSPAVIINSQDGQYLNTQLCGVGVVYQFCRYLDSKLNINHADDIIDLVALGLIGDMMSLTSLETLSIITKGLLNINNKLFQAIIQKQSFSIKEINPTSIAFYVVPLINAAIRMGTMEEKDVIFHAFIEPDKLIPSTKRGTEGTETLSEQAVRYMSNCKNRQTTAVKNTMSDIENNIALNGLLKNSILTVIDENINSKIVGLVANKVASEYQRPTLVLHTIGDNLVGSGRNYQHSEIEDFRKYLINTELFNFCEGHSSAFGTNISTNNLNDFIELTNDELKNIDFSRKFEVDFDFDINCPSELIFLLNKYKYLYGQGIFEPLISVRNIKINKDNISILGANKNTLKINGEVPCMKFFLTDAEKDYFDDIIFNDKQVKIDIVGKGNVNLFAGSYTPQIIIEDFEENNSIDKIIF